MRSKAPITDEEIQQALRKFLKEGGLIKNLPDEVVPRNLMVGAKWGMFEPVLETSGVGSGSLI